MRCQKAIENNLGLYEAVFAAHGLRWLRSPLAWTSTEKAPTYYSNLVTCSSEWQPDGEFRAIDETFAHDGWPHWSIKDSFANLDLRAFGFARLFDAQWIYLEAANFLPAQGTSGIRYELVGTADALSTWRTAWDPDPQLGKEIFRDNLLGEMHFVIGYRGAAAVAGCAINKTDDVLGISNCFCPDTDILHWSEMVGFVQASFGKTDMVGYERRDLVARLRGLGFENVGNLCVWLKTAETHAAET
jgi:hypothetical protein